jgi:hypothetical protein
MRDEQQSGVLFAERRQGQSRGVSEAGRTGNDRIRG